MTENDPIDSKTGDAGKQAQAVARKNRGIRFSDPEWEEVREAAQDRGITPAEFVRERILEIVRRPEAPARASIPTDLAPLIERTFRYTYMLATKMRADMIDAGDGEALDELVAEARALQDSLLGTSSS